MKKMKKRNHLIVALIVVLLALAIGYATFSATLNINGTANGNGTWNVHFKQAGRFLQADGTTVDNSHNGTAPLSTTSTAQDTMTVSVDLAYPGDGVLLEAVVENTGTIDAELTGFTINNNNEGLIVTKADGLATGETLHANGGTCTATFLIKWDPAYDTQSLGTKTFTITYNYAQIGTQFNGTPAHSDTTNSSQP